MRIQDFSKKSQVETVLGPIVSKAVAKMLADAAGPFGRKMKRLPWAISFYKTKPQFHLHDFETMRAYALNLETGEMTQGHYCGSGMSTINHDSEQLSQGESVPNGYALIFITSIHGGSGNTAWTLDIVTQNVTPQLETIQALQLKAV